MRISHQLLLILAFIMILFVSTRNVSAAENEQSRPVRACELFLAATQHRFHTTDETVQKAVKRLYPEYGSADQSAKARILLLKRVLAGESHALGGGAAGDVRLREETFQRLRAQTIEAISSPADLDTLVALLLFKPTPEARGAAPVGAVARRNSEYQRLAMAVSQDSFDLGALVHGESPAQSLVALAELGLNPHELRLYLIQSVYRMAADETITEPLVLRFFNALEALRELRGPDTALRVYDDFLRRTAEDAGGGLDLSVNGDQTRALIRMMLLTGHDTPDELSWVVNLRSPGGLMRTLRAILVSELGESGLDQRRAIVLRGASQVIAKTLATFHRPGAPREDALINAFEALARFFQTARAEIATSKGTGEFLVDVRPIGRQLEPGQSIRFKKIRIVSGDEPGWSRIEFAKVGAVNAQKFMRQQITHSTVVGNRLVLVTFGEPIEVLPAAILARLIYEQSRKEIAAIVSIDVKTVDDEAPRGAVRRLEEGIFAVTGESGSTGEAYPELAAQYFPTFILNGEIRPRGEGSGRLFRRLTRLLDIVGGGDTIIAVDTGGGVLIPTSIKHRYLHILADMHRIRGVNSVLLAEMLLGVNEINGAEAVLLKAGTRYHSIEGRYGDMQYRLIHETFGQWGANKVWPIARLAQTWDSALHGEYGAVALALPIERVLDPKEPVNPFAFILPQMQGVFFSDLRSILGAMGR